MNFENVVFKQVSIMIMVNTQDSSLDALVILRIMFVSQVISSSYIMGKSSACCLTNRAFEKIIEINGVGNKHFFLELQNLKSLVVVSLAVV